MLSARAILRTSRSVSRVSQQARGLHIENTLHNNFPFKYEKKKPFIFKATAFMGVGFALPFATVQYKKIRQ